MNLEITEQLKEKYNLSDSDVEEINAVLDSYIMKEFGKINLEWYLKTIILFFR